MDNGSWNNSYGSEINFACGIIGGNDTVLYFPKELNLTDMELGKWNAGGSWNFGGLQGPPSGRPMVLIFENDIKIRPWVMSGNIVIICKGNVTLLRNQDDNSYYGRLAVFANGNISYDLKMKEIDGSLDKNNLGNDITPSAMLISDQNITMENGNNFYGKFVSGGDIYLENDHNAYTDTIAHDINFYNPENPAWWFPDFVVNPARLKDNS